MKFKILVILAIFTFCLHDFAYSHSGRTNSAGCHNVTATGGYHCHGGGSSRNNSYAQSDSDVYLLLGLTVIIIGVGYWAYATDWGNNPQGCGCLLSQTLNNRISTHNLFNQTSMRIPTRHFKLPYLDLNRQEFNGYQLSATYTFRF